MKWFFTQAAFIALTLTFEAADAGTVMKLAGNAFAPPAFHSFCSLEPWVCGTGGAAETVVLGPQKANELKQVNTAVNVRVKERSDRANVARDDDWRVPGRYGDCEDFAIAKKHASRGSGSRLKGWHCSVLPSPIPRSK